MNDQKVELSLGLINGILQYLGSRPYGEVFQIVNALHEQATPQIKVPQAPQTDEAQQPVTDAA
jgi:hypothetical protein